MAKPKQKCTVEGCDRWRHSNGFCVMHFERWKHHGDPLWDKVSPTRGHHKPHTEESKRKMSEAQKGRPSWNKGVPMREESKDKLRKRVYSEETRQKIRDARLRQVIAPESIAKGAAKRRGVPRSPEMVAKISGENHYNWKGGGSRSLGRFAWRRLRAQVLERDGHACTICGTTEGQLIAHHIVPFDKGGPDTLDNLSTVCRACHINIHRDSLMSGRGYGQDHA